ncbi:MAG TPA: hypothetical protein VJV39_02310 [Dongiaceae bacterium]|nr:hypothetical protein [Dongiaceae bacterium]
MQDILRIAVREERHSHSVTRTATFNSLAGQRRVFFEISGDVLPPPLQVHDFAVLSALIVAMREGRPVHVEGPVTEALIRGLEEFQEAWAQWRSKYTPVRITADQIVPVETPTTRRGMFAFSGGVDGTFALLRHHKARAGLRTARPIGAMLVHGFDIPLSEQQAFDRARANVADVIGALGLPLTVVRTNWRSEACKVYPQEYLAGLTACLHQFRGLANVGVLGAGEDYAHILPPWGSNNPITNHLLSGGGFQIHTEGSGFTRTQRVALINDYPEIAAKLRVCWEGPLTGGNCGRCEKCIRTKLNFMAINAAPACFDDGIATHAQILGLTARKSQQLALLREVLTSARKNGARGAWTASLALAIARNRAMAPVWSLQSRIADKLHRQPDRQAARSTRSALQVEEK